MNFSADFLHPLGRQEGGRGGSDVGAAVRVSGKNSGSSATVNRSSSNPGDFFLGFQESGENLGKHAVWRRLAVSIR